MGISKTEKFTTEQNQLTNVAKALGHPARIAILEMLSNRNTCVCGDLADERQMRSTSRKPKDKTIIDPSECGL